MFPRASSLALVLLGCAGLAPALPIRAQLSEGRLAPAGRLRLEVSQTFDLWSNRFGIHPEGTGDVAGAEPLGFDLERSPLPLAPLEQGLRTALGSPSLKLELGSMRALVAHDRTRIAFGAALGVFEWLTLGASVPIVRARTEIAVDLLPTADASVGASPKLTGDGSVTGFLSSLAASRSALQAQVAQRCPAAADCVALTDLLGRYTSFATGLTAAYNGSPLFVTGTSAAGVALRQRLAALRAELAQRAPAVPRPGDAPLAKAPLDVEGLAQLLVDPAAGYQLLLPISTDPGSWQIDDVEVSAAIRLLRGGAPDSTGAAPFRYLVGAQALARLPTGHTDSPDIPFDVGGGDGQLDLDGGAFTDLRWTRVGVRAEAHYGVQRGTELVRRVAPPDVVFAPLDTRTLVRWTPGSYQSFEANPAWYLTDELALGGVYRLWSKQADTYEAIGSGDPSVLERETGGTLHEIGAGLAFSTLTAWREGRAPLPFEVHLAVRRGIAGSGGAVPKGTRMEATGRVFWRLWGANPL
ncbi:MAG: hypothetical protein EXR95_04125 [Gemmatimonadetes bacterium]|nr:hypothetical protein [Gemmatimonadota bacterium]